MHCVRKHSKSLVSEQSIATYKVDICNRRAYVCSYKSCYTKEGELLKSSASFKCANYRSLEIKPMINSYVRNFIYSLYFFRTELSCDADWLLCKQWKYLTIQLYVNILIEVMSGDVITSTVWKLICSLCFKHSVYLKIYLQADFNWKVRSLCLCTVPVMISEKQNLFVYCYYTKHCPLKKTLIRRSLLFYNTYLPTVTVICWWHLNFSSCDQCFTFLDKFRYIYFVTLYNTKYVNYN
jgi:hypothetical protein